MITELVSFRTFFRCLGERRGVEAGVLLAVVGNFFRELTPFGYTCSKSNCWTKNDYDNVIK